MMPKAALLALPTGSMRSMHDAHTMVGLANVWAAALCDGLLPSVLCIACARVLNLVVVLVFFVVEFNFINFINLTVLQTSMQYHCDRSNPEEVCSLFEQTSEFMWRSATADSQERPPRSTLHVRQHFSLTRHVVAPDQPQIAASRFQPVFRITLVSIRTARPTGDLVHRAALRGASS